MNLKRSFLALAATALLCTSCLGPNNAVRRVHTWNREIENRWLGEAVYFVIRMPVYIPCFLGDILIFNSIEFWGGTNPIDPPSPDRVQAILAKDAARAAED